MSEEALKLVTGGDETEPSSPDANSNNVSTATSDGSAGLMDTLMAVGAKSGVDTNKMLQVTENVMPIVDKIGKRKIIAGLGILALAASAFIGEEDAK